MKDKKDKKVKKEKIKKNNWLKSEEFDKLLKAPEGILKSVKEMSENSKTKKAEKKQRKAEKKQRKAEKKDYQKNKTRCVYIVLSKTSTLPSKVIKLWTRTPYVHTSLALDINLNEMYSFARKKLNNPFDCGFIYEDITTGVFGRDTGTKCLVRRLRITEKQWDTLQVEIQNFKANKDKYKYNYLGIFGVMFHKAVEREYNYFCSQFVYKILQSSGVKMFLKKPGLCEPDDFRTWKKLETVYEGLLINYRDFVKNNNIKDNVIPSETVIKEYNEKKKKRRRHWLIGRCKNRDNVVQFEDIKK